MQEDQRSSGGKQVHYCYMERELMEQVWPLMPGGHRGLYPVITTYMPNAYPAMSTLAERLGISQTAVEKYIDEMRRAGLFTTSLQPTEWNPNVKVNKYHKADWADPKVVASIVAAYENKTYLRVSKNAAEASKGRTQNVSDTPANQQLGDPTQPVVGTPHPTNEQKPTQPVVGTKTTTEDYELKSTNEDYKSVWANAQTSPPAAGSLRLDRSEHNKVQLTPVQNHKGQLTPGERDAVGGLQRELHTNPVQIHAVGVPARAGVNTPPVSTSPEGAEATERVSTPPVQVAPGGPAATTTSTGSTRTALPRPVAGPEVDQAEAERLALGGAESFEGFLRFGRNYFRIARTQRLQSTKRDWEAFRNGEDLQVELWTSQMLAAYFWNGVFNYYHSRSPGQATLPNWGKLDGLARALVHHFASMQMDPDDQLAQAVPQREHYRRGTVEAKQYIDRLIEAMPMSDGRDRMSPREESISLAHSNYWYAQFEKQKASRFGAADYEATLSVA